MIRLDICPVWDFFNPPEPIEIPEESPFTNGANVILIPSSVFINSKLNAIIQQAVGPDGSVNWGAVPDCLKNEEITLRFWFWTEKVDTTEFIGLDRSDPDESVSDWIEMTIVKRYCSLEDAEAILALALTTEINETTHEEALTYLCNSTKWHSELELSPERMNLHKDILKIIPLDGEDYRNAKQGPKPEEFDDYVNKLVSNFINLIKGLIMAIGRFIANIVKAIIKIGLSVLAVITALLLALIEALLKAIILAFIYLMFAITLIMFLTMFIGLIAIFLIVGPLLQANTFINMNSMTLQKGEKYFTFQYEKGLDYYDLLDIDIPTIYITYETDKILYESPFNFFTMFVLPPLDIILDQLSSDTQTTGNPKTSRDINPSNNEDDAGRDLLSGFFFAADLTGILFAAIGFIVVPAQGIIQISSVIVAIGTFIVSLVLFLIVLSTYEEGVSFPWLVGFLAGPFIFTVLALLIAFATSIIIQIIDIVRFPHGYTGDDAFSGLADILVGIGMVLAIIGLINTLINFHEEHTGEEIIIEDIEDELGIDIILGFGGIFIGGIALGIDEDYRRLRNILLISMVVAFIISILVASILF